MKKMKKFLNILHLEASPGWGGQEMRILKESQAMIKLGHNVIIGVEKNGGLINQAKKAGFLTYEIKFKKAFWIISFFKLLYIMKKNKIDILNTHSSSDAWLGAIVAKLLKIPIIRTRHLSTAIKKGLNSRVLYGYLADFVVTTCKDAANKIILQANKDPKKCKSIPTGVNFEKIMVSNQETIKFKKDFKIKNSDFLVGTACFMRSWKGIEDFLNAAKILEKEKNIKFLIIGGGHKASYIKMAKDLKLKNVIFTDHLENPYPAINALDIFTLLSTAHEGVSQASLQALFLQKPIIATSTGGLKEVCINKTTGIQVPVFSSKKVANAIIALKNDDKLRQKFAKNAKELSSKFSEDRMIEEMKSVYKKLGK